MKKTFFITLLIGLLAFSLIACGSPKKSDGGNGDKEVTVESIIELFDSDVYHAQRYNTEMISSVKQNMANQGISVSGAIVAIVHLTDQSATSENRAWAYVYEFSNEADAIAFEENRSKYVDVALEDGLCIRRGLIVVFGSASEISLIQ